MHANAVGARAQVHLTRGVTLAAFVFLAHAQLPYVASNAGDTSLPATKDVILNVTALDAKGHPVTDLTCADFQIFDEGKPQRIAPCNAAAAQPPTTLIFWDLLNSIRGHREYTSSLIVRALQPLTAGDSVYLYLLTNHGALYPVHALPTQPPSASGGQPPWTQQIHPLLDQAIQKVSGLRPVDEQNEGIRAALTFQRLGELEDLLTKIPGPKTIIWLTTGVSNWMFCPYGCQDLIFPGESGSYLAGKCSSDCAKWGQGKCIDYGPFLRHFSAAMARAGTSIHSLEEYPEGKLPPADRGSAKDTLQQLADLSGGRRYSGHEVEKAIAQSLEDARARYQLAFDAAADGKYHKLRVASTRKGIRVEAPRSYFADQR